MSQLSESLEVLVEMRLKVLVNENGFSLSELLVSTALLGAIALAVAALAAKMNESSAQDSSQSALLEVSNQLRTLFAEKKNAGVPAAPCASVFSLNPELTAAFDGSESAKNAVQVTLAPSVTLKNGFQLTRPNLSVGEFYLSNSVALGPAVGGRTNFISTLFLRASTNGTIRAAREIATMSVEINSIGQISQCHISMSQWAPKDACDLSFGMRWNAGTLRCEEALADDGTVTEFHCPPGFNGAPPSCMPIPSSCASGQIARSYKLGQVQDCQTPLTSVTGLVAKAPEPIDPENAPLPPMPAPVVQPAFAPPAADAISALGPTTASTSAPATCTDGSKVSALSFDACVTRSIASIGFINNSCDWSASPPAANAMGSCESTQSTSYRTPDLSVVAPDPPAPADLSCQCNNRRIGNHEYCMYCIPNVDLGFGYADYAYGVMQCIDGNLTDVSGPSLGENPVSTCTGNYGRARRDEISGRFFPYNELQ